MARRIGPSGILALLVVGLFSVSALAAEARGGRPPADAHKDAPEKPGPEAAPGEPAPPQLTPDDEVPRTEQAQKLARDLFARLNKSYYTLLHTAAQGFEATFAFEWDGEPAGKLSATWDRRTEQLRVSLAGDLSRDAQASMAKLVRLGMAEALLGFLRSGMLELRSKRRASGRSYAAKDGEWYEIDRTDYLASVAHDVTQYRIRVAENLKLLNVLYTYKTGSQITYLITAEAAKGKLRVATVMNTQRRPGRQIGNTMYKFEYAKQDGVPFIKGMDAHLIQGLNVARFKVRLENVTFRKGAKPTPGEGPFGEPLREGQRAP